MAMLTKSRLWLLCAWIVSTAGLVWQLHFILRQYLSYPTHSEIFIQLPDKFYVPSLSVTCDRNDTSQPNYTAVGTVKLVKRFSRQISSTSTVYSFLTGVTSMTYLIIPQIKAVFHKRNINYHDLLNVHHYGTLRRPHDCTEIRITLGESWPQTNEDTLIANVANSTVVTYITYTYKKTENLPHPYSKCFEYQESPIRCTRQCQNEQWLRQFNQILGIRPFNVTLLPDNSTAIVLDYPESLNLSATDHQVWQRCHRKCYRGDPCTRQFYSPLFLKSKSHPEYDKLIILLRPPVHPNITSNHVPKLQLIDLAVYIASSISFWLGISPLAAIIYCGRKMTKKSATIGQQQLEKLIDQRLALKQMIINAGDRSNKQRCLSLT